MTITRARTRAPYPLFATRGPLYTRENAVNELLFDFTEYGWDLIIYWGIKIDDYSAGWIPPAAYFCYCF